ncbi:hypothetical protein EDD16DRAFT_1520044 [Pisolithus croceorrhizus]|nr:hypothetical protein EDD16DRAFT_1520044 [Pisolithus croceorrhizus]
MSDQRQMWWDNECIATLHERMEVSDWKVLARVNYFMSQNLYLRSNRWWQEWVKGEMWCRLRDKYVLCGFMGHYRVLVLPSNRAQLEFCGANAYSTPRFVVMRQRDWMERFSDFVRAQFVTLRLEQMVKIQSKSKLHGWLSHQVQFKPVINWPCDRGTRMDVEHVIVKQD